MKYQKPIWSSIPLNVFSIQLILDGVIVFEETLDQKEFYTVGKENTDLIIDHPAIQSFHGVFQHSDEGFLFIYVTNGSKILLNKKLVNPETFEKLFPNDIIEFPNFPGLLVVSGPSFIKRTAKFFTSEGKVAQDIRESLQRVSWGFAEDATNEKVAAEDLVLFEDKLDYTALKSRRNLTEKQKKNIQKLEKLEEKIKHTEKMIETSIKNPEKLINLQEKLENLIGEKDLADENLRSSFFPEQKKIKKVKKGKYDYSSSEDEFYNRVNSINLVPNEKSKQEELDGLICERNELVSQITKLSVLDDEEDNDPLEKFMQSNNWELKEQSLVALGERLKKVNEEIEKVFQANPGLSVSSFAVKETEVKIGRKKRKIKEKNEEKVDSELEWMPPEGQTGDGRTSLNDKYGY